MAIGDHRHARDGSGAPPCVAHPPVGFVGTFVHGRGASRLRLAYPMTTRLLGDAQLGTVAQQYVRWWRSRGTHTSAEPASLSRFLRHAPSSLRADLPDLAALEEARTAVALEPQPEAIGASELAGLAPRAFLSAQLRFVAALRVLVLDHDALSLWRSVSAASPPDPPERVPTVAVVWRDRADVFHAKLDLEEALALESALAGDPLVRVCAAFGRGSDPARAAFAALASWFDEGWIAAVVSPGATRPAA
jgi:hypothetical protein